MARVDGPAGGLTPAGRRTRTNNTVFDGPGYSQGEAREVPVFNVQVVAAALSGFPCLIASTLTGQFVGQGPTPS